MKIETALIQVTGRIRDADDAQVAAIAESIKEVGLLNPITVYRRKIIRAGQDVDGFGLIAGLHRFRAVQSLGGTEIEAVVTDLDEQHRIIAECDENLCGSKLTPSQVAEFTAKRKAAYLALHPETARGGDRKSNSQDESLNPAFADDQSSKTGVSKQTVFRNAARGENILPEALALVRGTKLDKGTYLDRLAKVAPEDQVAAVNAELASQRRQSSETQRSAKIDADVKARAASEVAEIIAEHVPGDWWDGVKANLYAAGAKNIADALSNITGQSIMDRRHG